MLQIILFTCVAIYVLWIYMKRRAFLKKYFDDAFDGPPGWPFIGNMLELQDREGGLARGVLHAQLYNRTYKAFIGMEPVIFTSCPIFLQGLLASNVVIDKSRDYEFFKRWWGDGLLTSTGAKWRSRRKILTPAFHYQILDDFVGIFEKRGKLLINNLAKKTNLDTFDIFKVFTLYTLDVICETAMGTTIDAQTNPDDIYIKCVKDMCDITIKRAVSPFHRNDTLYEYTGLYRRELKTVSVLTKFSSDIIHRRREQMMQNKNIFIEMDDFGARPKCTFLDILLQSTIQGEPLTDEDIREEVDTFLFEGHDTTGIALSFIAFNLAKYPEIQTKCYEEIEHIFGSDKTRDATMEDLQNLKYLEKVIKESLRLYPSVPFHGRVTKEEVVIAGKTLPKGLSIAINQWALHRNEKYFEDPEKFDPERFDPAKQAGMHPYAYVPFSAGPRNCIGQKFAMLELKSATAKILRNFIITPSLPEFIPKLVGVATLLSTNGVNVRLRERQ